MLVGFDRPGWDAYFEGFPAFVRAQTVWPPTDPTPWIEFGKRHDAFTSVEPVRCVHLHRTGC